jgi:uncharacterized delta-60 repeat protein
MIGKISCCLLLACFFSQEKTFAQQGILDATFNIFDSGDQGDGFDGTVRTVVLQGDGDLIVGGEYLNFNGSSLSYLSRLKPDGTVDASFNLGAGFNGNVYCTLVQADGKIIVGGSFTKYNGVGVGRLIRLNSDGSHDTFFNTSIGATANIVYGIAQQPDGNTIVVGSFSKYNTTNTIKIARLLPDGNVDTSFATGSGALGFIEAVKMQADGKIVIAGSFNSFNNVSCNKIVRLNTNGSVDHSFFMGIAFDNNISTIAIQVDGKILVGGDFTVKTGVTSAGIMRLNTDGSIDSDFNSGSGFSDGGINVIKVASNGSIMVGGSFTSKYNGSDVNRIVLLNANGVIVPNFDIGEGPANASVYTVENASDGSWFIGGSFSVFESQNQGRLAKLDSKGTLDTSYLTAGVGFDNSVYKLIPLTNNRTMVFGSFTRFNGINCSRIACLREDGTLETTFNVGAIGANNIIRSAAIQEDGKIVIAGSFSRYNGASSSKIARILSDGARDPSFDIGTGANNAIYAVAIQLDGKIITVGNFTSFNGRTVNKVLRLMPSGALDTSFNVVVAIDGNVEAVLIQTDGKIVIGGRFSYFNGINSEGIARLNLDGSLDPSFSIGTGFNKTIYVLAMQSDNKIIVGGSFLTYGTVDAKRLVRLNLDGTLDSSFTMGTGFSNGDVRSLLVQPDNRILVGGTFSGTYNGISVKRMVRLLSNGVYDTTFSAVLNGALLSSCFTSDHKVMIGGNFNSVSGISKHRAARIKLCTNSSVWDGFVWDNGSPTATRSLIFNDDFTELPSCDACSCLIAAGKTVTIPDGNSLSLSFDYSGLGTLVLESNAVLYQSDDDIVNTGIIKLKRKTTPIVRYDYTYWSSPVANQSLYATSPETLSDKFFSFNSGTNNWFSEVPSKIMETARGYIIRGPQNFSMETTAVFVASFDGIPNNGEKKIDLGPASGFNLIGNPYPSAIDIDVFFRENAAVVKGPIYLWSHNTPITNNAYTSDDYAVYNLSGGVGTSPSKNKGVNNSRPNGKVASGQSFFIESVKDGGTAKFNDMMRIVGGNSHFFKTNLIPKQNKVNLIEKHRAWLNMYHAQGAFKQILVGYIADATDGYDSFLDGTTFSANKYIDFYSICDGKNLVIQAKSLPFNNKDEVILGYKTTVEGNYTIEIDEVDGLLKNQEIFILDKGNNSTHNLQESPYTFFTQKGTFNDRFVLVYTDKTLKTDSLDKVEAGVCVFVKDRQLKINSSIEDIERVAVYDISGKQLYEKKNINSNYFFISNLKGADQVVLISVGLLNGATVLKKVVL